MKIKEVLKMGILSVLSVAVLGGALVGTNNLVFANAAGRTVELAPLEAMNVTLTAYADIDIDTPAPLITIYEEIAPNSGPPGEDAISALGAVNIAARYILEKFDVDIEGSVAIALFNDLLSFGHMRAYDFWAAGIWTITIKIDGEVAFAAGINAATGEVLSVSDLSDPGIILPGRIINIRPDIRPITGVIVINLEDAGVLTEYFRITLADESGEAREFRIMTPEEFRELLESLDLDGRLEYAEFDIAFRQIPSTGTVPGIITITTCVADYDDAD
jgi:hypothetical protein